MPRVAEGLPGAILLGLGPMAVNLMPQFLIDMTLVLPMQANRLHGLRPNLVVRIQ